MSPIFDLEFFLSITYYSNVRTDSLLLLPGYDFKKALEIGGGDFNTLQELNQRIKKHDLEMWGIDTHKSKGDNVKKIIGSVESKLTKSLVPKSYFDIIIANDVVEHLVGTEDFVKFVYKSLKPGGLFLISVPNARQIRMFYYLFIKGTFPRKESGLFDKTHLRWFCKKDLNDLVIKEGFDLLNFKSVGRFVPFFLERSVISEFIALQNIFLFEKK